MNPVKLKTQCSQCGIQHTFVHIDEVNTSKSHYLLCNASEDSRLSMSIDGTVLERRSKKYVTVLSHGMIM